jgi:mono/diheme cytochrome c family protein
MNYFLLSLLVVMSLTLFSCGKGIDSPRGFSLPTGNIKAGKIAFLKYQCLACHTLDGVKDDSIANQQTLSVSLGGNKTKIVTYAELVTSIINPSHKFSNLLSPQFRRPQGESKMKVFNDVMTVTELIDLVSFLQPNYSLKPYQQNRYQYYPH